MTPGNHWHALPPDLCVLRPLHCAPHRLCDMFCTPLERPTCEAPVGLLPTGNVSPPPPGTTIDLRIAPKPHRKDALIDALYEVSEPKHPKHVLLLLLFERVLVLTRSASFRYGATCSLNRLPGLSCRTGNYDVPSPFPTLGERFGTATSDCREGIRQIFQYRRGPMDDRAYFVPSSSHIGSF